MSELSEVERVTGLRWDDGVVLIDSTAPHGRRVWACAHASGTYEVWLGAGVYGVAFAGSGGRSDAMAKAGAYILAAILEGRCEMPGCAPTPAQSTATDINAGLANGERIRALLTKARGLCDDTDVGVRCLIEAALEGEQAAQHYAGAVQEMKARFEEEEG